MEEVIARAAFHGEGNVHKLLHTAHSILSELRDLNLQSPSSWPQQSSGGEGASAQTRPGQETPYSSVRRKLPDSSSRLDFLFKQYVQTYSRIVEDIKIICGQLHRVKAAQTMAVSEDTLRLEEQRDQLRKEIEARNTVLKDIIDRMLDLQICINTMRTDSDVGKVRRIDELTKSIPPVNPLANSAPDQQQDDDKEDEPLSTARLMMETNKVSPASSSTGRGRKKK